MNPEYMAEQLGKFIDEAKISNFMLNRLAPLTFEESIQLFCEDVIPLL